MWRRALDLGVTTGDFTNTESTTIDGILGIFNYSYIWLREGATKVDPSKIADHFCDVLLHGIHH